jgi:tripartite-type tricarboxylate transporter receptor subunit TctC
MLAVLAGIATRPLPAEEIFPTRPVRFIVPAPAGGATDLVARTVGERMAQALGQSVLIDNRGGAGGNIAMDAVAKAAPDGYTIGMGAMSTNALNPHLYKKMPFDPRHDFTAIGRLGNSTIVLETHPALPVANVAQLLAHARAHPAMAYASAGAGTSMHLAGALFAQLSGTEWVHVPYKGSAPMITDLMAGHVSVAFDLLPASLPSIQAGKLRALAVAGSQRSPALPGVPTLAEAGLAGYTVEPWFGVFGPAGIPGPVVEQLNQAMQEALGDREVKDKLLAAGFTPRPSSAADLEALTALEYERLGRVARSAGMTVD